METTTSFFEEWAKFFEIELIHQFRTQKELTSIRKFIKQNIDDFVDVYDLETDPINFKKFKVSAAVMYIRMLKEINFIDERIETVRSDKVEQLSMFYNYEENDYVIILCDADDNEIGNWNISIGDDLKPQLNSCIEL